YRYPPYAEIAEASCMTPRHRGLARRQPNAAIQPAMARAEVQTSRWCDHRRTDCVEGGRSVRCASVLVARGVEAKKTRARPIAFAESIRYVQSYRTELEVRRDVLPQIQTPETGTRRVGSSLTDQGRTQ